jgi:hypothetical protein
MTGMPGFFGWRVPARPIPTPPAFSASYLVVKRGECTMAAIQEKPTGTSGKDATATPETESPTKIDPNAPAGSENSLGAKSVRDGRPATDDSTVEAMDEESPDITGTLDTGSGH